MRGADEKALVDAIIDGDASAKEISERASELGATLGERLTTLTKGILKRAKQGRLTVQAAERAYREAYLQLALIGYARVAGQVLEHAEEDVSRIKQALKKLGSSVRTVQAVRKADRLEREKEKQGA